MSESDYWCKKFWRKRRSLDLCCYSQTTITYGRGVGIVFTRQNSNGLEQLLYSSNDVRYVEQSDPHGACNMRREKKL